MDSDNEGSLELGADGTIDQDKGVVTASCTLKFSKRLEGKPEVKFRADIEYLVHYEWQGDEPLSQDDASLFASLNGIYNAWPYFRSHIQFLASSMRAEIPPLPTFRIESLLDRVLESMPREDHPPKE